MFSSPTNYYLGYATGTATNNNTETIILRAPWVASITPQPIYTVPLTINGTGTVTQNGVVGATAINPTACVISRGQSLNLVATGNFLCWTGATNTTASNITLYPSQDTNLTANFVGVTSLAPQISLQPQGQSINQGNTLTLLTAAVGVPTPDFQWQFNGANIGAGSTLTISNITIASQGSYQCVLSNTAGSITSSVAAVVVDQPPTIVQQPVTQLAAIGGSVVFSVIADAVNPTCQWYLNGTPIPSATNRRLEITGITSQDAGNYDVVISSCGFAVQSAVAQLILLTPPTITQEPEGTNATTGDTINLTVSAAGTGPLAYQWQWNGSNLVDETNATLSMPDIQTNQSGNYEVTVSNAQGSVVSSNVPVVVSSPLVTTQPAQITQNQIGPAVLTIAPIGNGQMSLSYSGAAGQTCQIQASADLIQWDIVGTTATTAGVNLFIDTNASQYPSRFYRVKVVQ
jgi:ligand-binding SRPBCC domain-containing protein